MNDQQTPQYRARIALKPSTHARHRYEAPFSSMMGQPDVWQYGTEPIAAGEIVTTTSWPHPSFIPLTESAKKVQSYFAVAVRSRLALSPFRDGRLVLDDGLTGAAVGRLPGPSLPKPFGGKTAA